MHKNNKKKKKMKIKIKLSFKTLMKVIRKQIMTS